MRSLLRRSGRSTLAPHELAGWRRWAALGAGCVLELIVIVPFAALPSGSYRGVPGALGVLAAMLTAVLAGPLPGAAVAAGGAAVFVGVVTGAGSGSWVAILVWPLAALAAGAAATQFTRARDERKAHAELTELLGDVDALVWEADPDGVLVRLTGPVEKLLGRPREELVGRDLAEVAVHPGDRDAYVADRERLRDAPGSVEVEYRALHADGTELWLADRIRRVNAGGSAARLRGVTVDVSEQRALQSELAQTRKLEAVGHLASGIAHDFNNVLTAMIGFASLLLHRGVDEDTAEHLEEIVRAGERGTLLTNRLLSFSRRRIVPPRTVDLVGLVEEMHPMLQRLIAGRARLDLRLAGGPCLVVADPGQLEQLLMNLVVNARDALPAGGTIQVETTVDGAGVVLAIRDDGTGMDEQTRRQAFSPFFTTKAEGEGTGLGLATVLNIVDQLGGTIALDSEPDRGTAVSIQLPAAQDGRPGHAARGHGPAQPPRTLTVLVAEDDEVVRALVRTMLEAEGHQVLEAADGREAIRIAGESGEAIDLLLTDSLMPGVRGPELANRLRSDNPELKVVYMSGFATRDDEHETIADAPFLEKPFTIAELHAALDRALAGP